MLSARPGTALSLSRAASDPSTPTRGSRRSAHRLVGIKSNTTLHIRRRVERTALLRVDRGAVIEIGICEPVTE